MKKALDMQNNCQSTVKRGKTICINLLKQIKYIEMEVCFYV